MKKVLMIIILVVFLLTFILATILTIHDQNMRYEAARYMTEEEINEYLQDIDSIDVCRMENDKFACDEMELLTCNSDLIVTITKDSEYYEDALAFFFTGLRGKLEPNEITVSSIACLYKLLAKDKDGNVLAGTHLNDALYMRIAKDRRNYRIYGLDEFSRFQKYVEENDPRFEEMKEKFLSP